MSASTITLNISFVRKPVDLHDVIANSDPDKRTTDVYIELHQALTTAEYDRFAVNLLRDYEWLRGRGGYINNEARSVVKVTAPDRTTLYVDPSGNAYGRYVGIAA